jgi:hypothetical protein
MVMRLSWVSWEKFLGIHATIFDDEYVLHFEIEPAAIPNVRAKRGPTVGWQARETENSEARLAGLTARRWGSA